MTDANAPILGEVQMHAVQPKAPVVGRVVSSQPCLSGRSASFVRHICIDVSGTPLAGSFRVGQAFGVVAPGEDDRGRPHAVRLYSLACPSWGEDGEGAVISTTVKRVIDEFTPDSEQDDPDAHHLFLGVCSNYLCDLKVGDPVLVTGPAGRRFLLPQDPDGHDYLFIATGTGIAPFYGMVRELLQRPGDACDRRVDLIAGAPYSTDLIYDRFFSDLAEACPNFNYHRTISRSDVRGEYVDRYLERNLDSEGFRDLLEGERTLVYMCGVEGMQSGVYRMLARHGLSRGYMEMRDPLTLEDHEQWDDRDMKRGIRPGPRCLVEVY
ncbi:MAG: hypothetical protein VX727_05305 [Planctomycetota bacterium]|nr:hypothetical protein [Planctomycetota bacterium]